MSGTCKAAIEMGSNITLIGMPGAGKSTVGVILAKELRLDFIDTDVLIQVAQQKTLQQIIDESDHLNLRGIEEEILLKIDCKSHVIATGGSAVYSEKAMCHLREISRIVFLEISFQEVVNRVRNAETRGIAKGREQSLEELFKERQVLYRTHAEITIDCNTLNQEQLATKIAKTI